MDRVFSLGVAVLLVASASAQDRLGYINNTGTTFTSRGGNATPNAGDPSVAWNKIDKESYAGWGFDPMNPGMRTVNGLWFVIQDQVGMTVETYSIVLYTEDAAAPNFPDVVNPVGTAGPFNMPNSTATGAAAFAITANFATPLAAPVTGDVFVGVEMPQPPGASWPADGLSIHALSGAPGGGTRDFAGAGLPAAPPELAGFGGWFVPATMSQTAAGPTYSSARMFKMEPIVPGAAGVATAVTNQPNHTASNAPPGTSSQFSGLYPDAANPPLNAGRVDDIGNRFFLTGIPDGSPVFFLMDFGNFGPEIPVSNFLANSTGVSCLNLISQTTLAIGTTTSGEAWLVVTIPAGARSIILGLPVVQQAAGFDVFNAIAHAGPCTRQIL